MNLPNMKTAGIAAANTAIDKMTGPIMKAFVEGLPAHWKELLQKLHAPTMLDVISTISNATLQDKGEVLGMLSNLIGEASSEFGEAINSDKPKSASSEASEDALAEIMKVIFASSDNPKTQRAMMDNLTELEKDRDAAKIRAHLCLLGNIGIMKLLQGRNADFRTAWANKVSKKKETKIGILGLLNKAADDISRLDRELADPNTAAGKFNSTAEQFTQFLERKAGLRP